MQLASILVGPTKSCSNCLHSIENINPMYIQCDCLLCGVNLQFHDFSDLFNDNEVFPVPVNCPTEADTSLGQ